LSAYSVAEIVWVVATDFAVGVVVGVGAATSGRSWLFKSWDEEVVIEVLGSLPVRELRPRKAVSTKTKVNAIFDDLPASSVAFL
jgi:hypothetical protein